MHPIENGSNVQLSITADLSIDVIVLSSELNADTTYHYHLQGQASNGNDSATVQFNDVAQQLVIGKQ